MNNENSIKRQIDFLKTHYNNIIVDAAIEYAEKNIEKHISYPHDSVMLMLAKEYATQAKQQDIANLINKQIKRDESEAFDLITFAYVNGVSFGLTNPNISVNPEPKTDYVLNKDFAFIFDYGDNDFGVLIQSAAQKFCDEYNSLLRRIELYSDCTSMLETYKMDLEKMENPANVRSLMKALFIGEYMSSSVDRFWIENEQFNAEKKLKKAEELANTYFHFDSDTVHFDIDNTDVVVWKFGTWDDVSKYGLEEYKELQGIDELNYADGDFSKYWLNGEVLIVRMINGELIAETK